MSLTPRERLKCAIEKKKPDRLPVTTHHIMPAFLEDCVGGIGNMEFFETFRLDPIVWIVPYMKDDNEGQYYDTEQKDLGFLEGRRVCTQDWNLQVRKLDDDRYDSREYSFETPDGILKMVYQANRYTTWIAEHPIKNKNDIHIIEKYMPVPVCDVDAVNVASEEIRDEALLRSHCFAFQVGGQPGCWQDACCLYGTERMIMATYDDPQWVHEFLMILLKKKLKYFESMKGADFDILELGGGDASTTVISPQIFNTYVAPYDAEIIAAAHRVGQKIVYHTCGGMMPILEDIAAMGPDAMETFTPPGMGGDSDLAEAKRRIGDKVCIIGGFDQSKYFEYATEEETRKEVRKCFQDAGEDGGYILCPSDHFFTAKIELLHAFADEARTCVYS